MKRLTSDDARLAFVEADLDYDTLRADDIHRLHLTLQNKLLEDKYKDLLRGQYRIFEVMKINTRTGAGLAQAYIYCSAGHFEKREAISFNPDGFIGFAGWASSANQDPMVEGFMDWLKTFNNVSI